MHGAPASSARVGNAFRAIAARSAAALVCAAFAIALCGLPARAQQPAPTTWAVRMAEGSRCVADPSFLQTLKAQIPEEQRAPEARAELVAEVAIENGVARIHVFDRVLAAEAGSRELPLEARHCVDIAEAVALVIGVLAEAGRGALASAPPSPAKPAEKPREQLDEEQPPPARSPAPSEPPRAQRSYPRMRPVWRGPPAGHDLLAAVGIELGLVKRPVLAYSLAWGIRPANTWPIWLQANAFTGAEGRDGLATISAIHGGIFTCPLHRDYARVRLRACAGFQAGAALASSRDLYQTRAVKRPLALAGIELAAHVRLVGPLEFVVLGRADALLMRSRFYYVDEDGDRAPLYEPKVVVGGPFAGFGLKLR